MTNNDESKVERPFKIENNVLKGKVVPFQSRYTNIGNLLFDAMKANRNLVQQVDPVREIEDTFGDVLDISIKCALWMQQQGVGDKDIIVVSSQISRECFVPLIAALFIGAIFSPWDDERDTDTYSHYIKLEKPKLVFANKKSAPVIQEAAKLVGHQMKMVSFDDYPGMTPFADTLKGHSKSSVTNFQCAEVDPDIAIIMFTSGTTSTPKAIPFLHRRLLKVLELWDLIPINVVLCYSNLYWISGPICYLKGIILRWKQIIAPHFEEELVCKIIEKYKVSFLAVDTRKANLFVRYNHLDEYDFSSLRAVHIAGSLMYKETQDLARKRLPSVMFIQAYGLTEFCYTIVLQSRNSMSGSCGFVCPNCEVKIIDPKTGEALGPYQQGEICGKSVTMMPGYYKNPEATKNAIDEDGWLHTGDIGYYNENGELFILNRTSELIKFKDRIVIPSEIEAVLLAHPSVLEVAVIGKPDPADGEHPIAFVKKVPDREVSEDELIELVANKLMDHCRLRGGVKFLPSLPYTPTQKIWKMKLLEMLETMRI